MAEFVPAFEFVPASKMTSTAFKGHPAECPRLVTPRTSSRTAICKWSLFAIIQAFLRCSYKKLLCSQRSQINEQNPRCFLLRVSTMISSSIDSFVSWWLGSPPLTWGAGPLLAANLGLWPMFFFLSWYTHRPSVIPSLVTWIGDTPGSRLDDVRETNDKVPHLSEQLWGSNGAFATMCGPNALFGGIASYFVMNALVGLEWPALTLWSFFLQLVSLYVLGDLGLYWGHRVMHGIPFLYHRFHSIHHTIKTPTPLVATYIHPVDTTLQTSLPIIAAAALVRPHPASFYAYVSYCVAERVLDHSGLDDGSVFNALFLKFECLGRAKASHHDFHHRFGGHPGKVMNLGEGFWFWDWAFGTLANRTVMRAKST